MKGKGDFLTSKLTGSIENFEEQSKVAQFRKLRETEEMIRRTEWLINQRPDIAHILRIELAGYRNLLTKLKQGHSE